MITMRWTHDFRGLIRIEQGLVLEADEAVQAMADAIVEDIKNNWYAVSPSPPGGPPAIDKGFLDAGIKVEKQPRDLKGRFTSAPNGAVRFIRVDTRKSGRSYAEVVEEGSHENEPFRDPRPYLAPAVARANDTAPLIFRRYLFKKGAGR